MALHVLKVTTEGKVVLKGQRVFLKIPGARHQFVLVAEQNKKSGGPAAYQRLRSAVKNGPLAVTLSGRVVGWQGNFTRFLSKLPDQPRRIAVHDFQMSK